MRNKDKVWAAMGGHFIPTYSFLFVKFESNITYQVSSFNSSILLHNEIEYFGMQRDVQRMSAKAEKCYESIQSFHIGKVDQCLSICASA